MQSNINRIKKILYLIFSVFIHLFTKISKDKIVCWSYSFTQYSCNPRYIAEYLQNNHTGEFKIYWVQFANTDIADICRGIEYVKPYSLKYFWLINTAKILITNKRTDLFTECFIKKKSQIYIQTWHGLLPLKKIEKDAECMLANRYVSMAKRDSRICDLILSGCRYSTVNIKSSFWYDGEILEKGLPRDEILFSVDTRLKHQIFQKYNLAQQTRIVLYAPTFRKDYSLEVYQLKWTNIISALNDKFGNRFIVMMRLHPNVLNKAICITSLTQQDNVVDVTYYPDMQELIAIADVLITDYSSSMFEAALVGKPCFLYAPDADEYNRGFYFGLDELPFPVSKEQSELVDIINNFNQDDYISEVNKFNTMVGMVDNRCNSNSELYNWIKARLI